MTVFTGGKDIRDLVVALRPPAAIAVNGRRISDEGQIVRGVLCTTGFPPWPVAADLLVISGTREFSGLAYQVPNPFRQQVRELVGRLDQRCAAYIEGQVHERPPAYRREGDDVEYFQLLWGDDPDELVAAQLAGDVWFYHGQAGSGIGFEQVEAVGLADFQDLLREYELNPPRQLRVSRGLPVKGR